MFKNTAERLLLKLAYLIGEKKVGENFRRGKIQALFPD